MKKQLKRLMPTIIIFIVGMVILALIGVFYASFFSYVAEEETVRYYYTSDGEAFNKISGYFGSLYAKGLTGAEFEAGSDLVSLQYEQGEEKADCGDGEFVSALASLRDKYQQENEYPVFSFIKASYDGNGKMLLYVQARKKTLSAEKIRVYYLVYIDAGYKGGCPSLSVEPGFVRDPFEGNWCLWVMEGAPE